MTLHKSKSSSSSQTINENLLLPFLPFNPCSRHTTDALRNDTTFASHPSHSVFRLLDEWNFIDTTLRTHSNESIYWEYAFFSLSIENWVFVYGDFSFVFIVLGSGEDSDAFFSPPHIHPLKASTTTNVYPFFSFFSSTSNSSESSSPVNFWTFRI